MFKVECPGCKAPYQVDERRVPVAGLKMRCPKCGTSFKVDPPLDPRRTGPSPVFGMEAPESRELSLQDPIKSTMLGVAPIANPRAAPPRPGPKTPAAVDPADDAYGEVDLPMVGGAGRRAEQPSSPEPALPALAGKHQHPVGQSDRKSAPANATVGIGALEAGITRPLVAARAPVVARRGLTAPMAPVGDDQDLGGEFGELDLPAPAGAPIPGRAAGPPADEFGEIDLPTLGNRGGSGDLPAIGQVAQVARAPEPLGGGLGFGDIDLPTIPRGGSPRGFEHAELPQVGAHLPSRAVGQQAGGLPVSTAALPMPAAGLPMPASSLPTAAMNLPQAAAALPLAASALPATTASLPQPAGQKPVHGDHNFELPLGEPAPASPYGAPWGAPGDSFGPPQGASGGVVRQADGGTGYGEVNLGSIPPGSLRPEDEMEFGAVPQERYATGSQAAPPAFVPAAQTAQVAQAPVPVAGLQLDAPPRGRRLLRGLMASLVVVVLGGFALALVPSIGPFGWYWVNDRLKAGEYQKLVSTTVSQAQGEFSRDAYPEAKRALDTIERTRSGARRVSGLASYAAFAGFLRDLRFGSDPEVRARSQVLLDELKDLKQVPHLELAQAAGAAVNGQLARARQLLGALAGREPRNIDVLVTRGELELRAREPKAALDAWQAAAVLETSARTAYGLARAHHAAGDHATAEKQARAVLEQNKDHVGAKILLARIMSRVRESESDAIAMLDGVVKATALASPGEIVLAETLLGDIHLARSRVTHAENAYAEALKLNPKAARALAGLGDTLYRAGRYSEALARFDAATQADPDDLVALVGIAKTKLALERVQDANAMLKKLRESHPKSMLVNYWYGQAQEAIGNRKDAEAAYRTAVDQGGKDPDVVVAFVALAQLLNQQGRTEEAQKELAESHARLPDSPAVRKALGELALAQGRYEDAVRELQTALGLDKDDVGAKFRLGGALRRNRQFEEASKAFDEVAAVDRDYPGLALERGQLYEASGRSEEALKSYESALSKAPTDPDLMLRVGCSKVSAGRAAEAQLMLRKVLSQRPNSADTNHCLGRALLVEGKNLAEALRVLERSIELDPHRAEYWLYVGWAANEAGRVPRAETALKKALELDQGLADAYWQRGVLKSRQGAVRDAISDLKKALELRPSRFEAHAALADALYDADREQESLSEWQKAISAQPENAGWRFRYGKLLQANRRDDGARAELTKAIELSETMDPKPRWLWEAHHLLARAIGPRPEAAKHWKAFLVLGPRDSAYRDEAKSMLRKLGQPWDGD